MATVVRMPALSDTMTEGVLVAWHKKVGDTVKSGDLLAEIETDKAVMEFESFYNGTLLYAIEAGQSIQVDAVIAVIGRPDEDWRSAVEGGAPAAAAPAPEKAPAPQVVEAVMAPLTAPAPAGGDDRVKASPLAKAIAKQEGLDLQAIKGSGDEGRIVKRDVEALIQNRPAAAAQAAPTPAPEAQGDYTDIPLTQMRKTIARRLGESMFTAPHFYLTMEIEMDKCMAARTSLNEISPVKLSFNDFVVKATAMALRRHPAVNSAWLGDKIRQHHYVNMGVAVAVDEGLLVPVLRNADLKSLSQIASEVREFAEKARDRKLQPQDMSGNTFTISNLGMFGIEEFTAIINPPDACILAVGRIAERPVRGENNTVAFANFMKVTLSCDHRVVDGALGAKFLQTLKELLEDPMRMLV
jgi:pyruvate dehydrogenase E2 component (dihydrolipoamide acetyltransferase)